MTPGPRLQDKVAIVTGAARGIGEGIARGLADAGASVVVADRSYEQAQAVARDIGGGASAHALDVRDARSIEALVDHVVRHQGGIDVLVNNAAVFDLAPLLDIREEDLDRVFAVNVKGVLLMLQAVARQMVRQGRGGKIINVASQAGRRGAALEATYCASKAAVISLTQSAALELVRHGIGVNAIAPGVVDTPMWDEVDALFARYEHTAPGNKRARVIDAVPAGRMGTPDDYRGVAVFLASQDSDYVVGQVVDVNGGTWIG